MGEVKKAYKRELTDKIHREIGLTLKYYKAELDDGIILSLVECLIDLFCREMQVLKKGEKWVK